MNTPHNHLDDYNMLSVIGKGSYAKVLLVRCKATDRLYAMKSMKKKYIQKKKQVMRIMTERNILTEIDHPFLIKIHCSFQNQAKVFLILEYCPGGELFGLLSKNKRLSQSVARFYAAQILLAIQYLHSKNIIYRDLKPENILIGADGYLKLTDFGLSRNNIHGDYDIFQMCGTPEYLAPEVIKQEGHGRAVDWWCLGALIYELVNGMPPFYAKSRGDLYQNITKTQPVLNKNWSKNLRDLLSKLLTKNPEERMKHIPTIKQHPWFAMINWQQLSAKQINAPFIPILKDESDVSNFAKLFTKCSVESHGDSLGDCHEFEGFSFSRSEDEISIEELKNSNSDQEIDLTTEQMHEV